MEKLKILCYHTSVKITLMRDPIVPNRKGKNSMEQFFKLKEHGTDVKTELAAGLTTFMTMAYILAVNPSILSASGMDSGAIFTATALASAIASFLMAFLANLPFVLSAGMGLNAYFAYTVVLGMGYSWQMALTAVFVEGLIFVVLSLTNVREAIFNAIPATLKIAVSVGIGLFITFIGLQNAHIVVDSATLVSVFSFKGSIANGTFNSEGITVLLAILGILITAILMLRNVKGAILLGILALCVQVAEIVLGISEALLSGLLYEPQPFRDIPLNSVLPEKGIGAELQHGLRAPELNAFSLPPDCLPRVCLNALPVQVHEAEDIGRLRTAALSPLPEPLQRLAVISVHSVPVVIEDAEI